MASGQSMAHARLLEAISPKRNRQSAHRTPPSQQLRRVFYFPERGHSKFLRRSRNGRPGSLGSRRHARARSAGPAGGNEAQAGYRWQSEPGKGSLWRRAVESAATEFVFQFGLPHLAAQRTLVVKISDTSHHGKSGFESRL